MNKRVLNYFVPIIFFGTFLGTLFIWNMAIGPQPVKKQMVICYKFNENTDKVVIEKHIADFRNLKLKNSEIVNYTAGFTISNEGEKPEYDVMHYLTFKTDKDIENFKSSESFKDFVNTHESNWKTQMVINAEIK